MNLQQNHQNKVLSAIENPKIAEVLANMADLIEDAPLQAARLVRQFEQATAVVSKAVTDIPECWKKIEDLLLESELRRSQFTEDLRKFRTETIEETRACADALGQLKGALQGIDDSALNKANRVLEVCEKLAKAKKDGTFDLIAKLK